jgi:hypothetical protein
MKETGLTYTQVLNWTTNIRKRKQKATIEKKKEKSRDVLDFMFLAQNRDNEMTRSLAQQRSSFSPPPPPPAAATAENSGAPTYSDNSGRRGEIHIDGEVLRSSQPPPPFDTGAQLAVQGTMGMDTPRNQEEV